MKNLSTMPRMKRILNTITTKTFLLTCHPFLFMICLVMIMSSVTLTIERASAQPKARFMPGDIYLLSRGTPYGEAILRIDLHGGGASLFTQLPAISGGFSYDAFRDVLLIITDSGYHLQGVRSSGNLVSIAGLPNQSTMVSARGDGLIYTYSGITGFSYVDAFGNVQSLDGTDYRWGTGMNKMFYHRETNALFLSGIAANMFGSGDRWATLLIKIPLEESGTKVEGTVQAIEANILIDGFVGAEAGGDVSYGPVPLLGNPQLFLVVGTNSGVKLPRMLTFDPFTMGSLEVYVENGPYIGAANSGAAVYSRLEERALILDTANNVIRAFKKDDDEVNRGGQGTVIASGVSSEGCCEAAWMLEIGTPTPNQPPKTPATYIVTHGFQLDPGVGEWKEVRWPIAMADAVSPDRQICFIRKGKVYQTKLAYPDFAAINEALTLDNLVSDPAFFSDSLKLSPERDVVFVFDWVDESDLNTHGYTEAAGDALFAALINTAKQYPWLLNELHFIGHSRGTVVNSEAIQRLLFATTQALPPDVGVDKSIQMTTLDAHPSGHWKDGYEAQNDDRVNKFVNSALKFGVVGWKGGEHKVSHIDNYFQTEASLVGLNSYPGLNQSPWATNIDLTNKLDGGSHSLVHTWYFGTVDLLHDKDAFGHGPDIKHQLWYDEIYKRSAIGFYYSAARSGNRDAILSIENALIDVGEDLNYGPEHLVYNGDFSKNLGTFEKIPGWDYQGGGGDGYMLPFNNSLMLSTARTRVSKRKMHNSLYIPNNVSRLYYRVKVNFDSPDYRLVVRVGNIESTHQLNKQFNYQLFSTDISFLRNSVQTIEFALEGGPGIPVEVQIDDVGFEKPKYLSLSVASPVELHVFDSYGNHTGPTSDTTWVEGVPGSQYITQTDSLSHLKQQVILPEAPPGVQYFVQIKSQNAIGSFDFEIQDVTDTLNTVTTFFDSVLVQPNTVAACTLKHVNPQLNLRVDVDGNGIFESTVKSSMYLQNLEIVAQSEGEGSISPSGKTIVNYGDSPTFTISPATGNVIEKFIVDGVSVGPVSSYTFNNITKNHSIAVTFSALKWSVQHIVDADDVILGINQGAASWNNRGLALSSDERFLYLGYILNRYLVRKIDLSVADPANNHRAVVAQLILPSGTQPAKDIATDDRGRVYLALGTKIAVYNSNLQTPPLHIISGFTACEGVTTRREKGKLVVYATDRLDKTLERFVLAEGTGEAIISSKKAGLDGDGEVRIVGASSPGGLAIGKYGSAWIADIDKGQVYRVNAAGRTVDSTVVGRAMDVAIDTTRGEVYISQYTLRTLKVLNVSTGKVKRTLTPPAADLKVTLKGETGFGALSGIDVASHQRVFVANEKGRSILTGNLLDSPFSNVGDNNNVKATDTDPVLVVTGNVVAKESEVEESEVTSDQLSVTSYQLEQNYPNPFNPSTKISFTLPEAAEVSLKIYDITGQLVQTLVGGVVKAGRHQVVWDGTNRYGVPVASGVYFYKLRAGEFKQVRKMSLVR